MSCIVIMRLPALIRAITFRTLTFSLLIIVLVLIRKKAAVVTTFLHRLDNITDIPPQIRKVTGYNGFIYYLADSGKTVNDNPHAIYKIKLNDDTDKTIDIQAEYRVDLHVETEGLTIDCKGNVYFGTAQEKIYKLDAKYNELVDYRSK